MFTTDSGEMVKNMVKVDTHSLIAISTQVNLWMEIDSARESIPGPMEVTIRANGVETK